jgi:hypothetical protein
VFFSIAEIAVTFSRAKRLHVEAHQRIVGEHVQPASRT